MMKRYMYILFLIIMAMPVCLHADDTSIYGTDAELDIKPNVLILFDTSGSMTNEDIPGEAYDSSQTYTASGYEADKFYQRSGGSWVEYGVLSDWDEADSAYIELVNSGEFTDYWCDCMDTSPCSDYEYIGATSNSCPGGFGREDINIATGNFLNYVESGDGDEMTRNEAARKALKGIIDTYYDQVEFGIMRLNGSNGGRLIYECGAETKTTLMNAMNDTSVLPASGNTPIGEALAEAGLYYAGKDSWYGTNGGDSYTTPIDYVCQNNFVILMTDGEPTRDGYRIYTDNYINGDRIPNQGGSYVENVAWYLYNRDVNPDIGSDSYINQYVKTYTIGFSSGADSAETVLTDTAAKGGGEYFKTDTISGLANAFEEIVELMLEESTIFAAPVVPVNRVQRTADSDSIYLAFFKPQQGKPWIGNIKKFYLGSDGEILDFNRNSAVKENSELTDNSQDLWASSPGGDVDEGGVGELLMSRNTSRELYTYLEVSSAITSPVNEFTKTNTALNTELKSIDSDMTDEEIEILIDDISGEGKDWKLGDIIHSEPAVVHYPDSSPGDVDTVVYAGSNDGMIHAFNDANGSEMWGFIPPGQLGRLSLMQADYNSFFIDGHITVTYGAQDAIDLFKLREPQMLIFGERRGGSNYYAININNSTSPVWKYRVDENYLSGSPGFVRLGQSWGKVQACKITTGLDSDNNPIEEEVFIFSGGYDEDQDSGWQLSDDRGKVVFATKQDEVVSGKPVLVQNFTYSADGSIAPTNCIIDVNAYDRRGYGIVTRLYFGDLGGNVYAVADDVNVVEDGGIMVPDGLIVAADGEWNARIKLFSASTAGVASAQRKIMYAPARATVRGYDDEFLFFGTGNRADPSSTTVRNRFYAVRNNWIDRDLTESLLYDVSAVSLDETQQEDGEAVVPGLSDRKGWYFDLNYWADGEKVVSAPIVYRGLVIFTTYTPPADSGSSDSSSDPCEGTAARGQGRLYVVYADNGCAYFNDGANDTLDPQERPTDLPSHLPLGTPMIDGNKVRVGTWTSEELPDGIRDKMEYYFWRKANRSVN